ncbi:MAG: hypothetical protein J7L42_02300 [Elusimicrobia bacterium]|nr:hypothetical protein [Elusimicrobiota bacterium]
MRIFFLILLFSQFLFSEEIFENFCRGKFEITLFYKKPVTEKDFYEVKVLKEKVTIFSNLLEIEISNMSLRKMLYIDVNLKAKIFFDPVRMKVVLPYKGIFFDIDKNLIKVFQFLGLSKPKSIHQEDFFGSPVKFKDGFLFQSYKDTNFLLTYNNKKRTLILTDPHFFSGVKSFLDRFIFYKTANSLWFIDTKLRRNEMVFKTEAGEFITDYICDGRKNIFSVVSKNSSNIYAGPLYQKPEKVLSEVPYVIKKIARTKKGLIFFARFDTKTAVLFCNKKYKILKIVTFPEKSFFVGELSDGIVLFFPKKGKVLFLSENTQEILARKTSYKKVEDCVDEKFFVFLKDENLWNKFSHIPSSRIMFFKDKNRMNFVLQNMKKENVYSITPLGSTAFFLLEYADQLRKFKKYDVRGLLSQKEYERVQKNRLRHISLIFISVVFFSMIIWQVIRNAKTRKEAI